MCTLSKVLKGVTECKRCNMICGYWYPRVDKVSLESFCTIRNLLTLWTVNIVELCCYVYISLPNVFKWRPHILLISSNLVYITTHSPIGPKPHIHIFRFCLISFKIPSVVSKGTKGSRSIAKGAVVFRKACQTVSKDSTDYQPPIKSLTLAGNSLSPSGTIKHPKDHIWKNI